MAYKINLVNYSASAPEVTSRAAPSLASPDSRAQRLRKHLAQAWFWIAVAAAALSIWAHLQIGLNNDHLSLLDDAKKLLVGRPLTDIVDVSPPLIFYIYAAAVWLAQATGIGLHHALYIPAVGLSISVLLLSNAILSAGGASPKARLLAAGGIALSLFGASLIHQPFADREHLMLVLATPWFILFSPLVKRGNVALHWRVIAAVLSAIGFAIKPYFYVFYLATAGWQLATGARVRDLLRQPEHYIVGGFVCAYVAFILIYDRHYVTELLPMGWRTYDALGWPLASKIEVIRRDLLLGFAAPGVLAMVALFIFAPRRIAAIQIYLCVLLLAALASYLLNAGWYYTQYPFIAVSLLLALASGAALLNCAIGAGGLIAIVIAMGAGLGYYFVKPALWRAGWDLEMQRSRGHPLSTIMPHPAAVARLDAHFATRPRFIFLATNLWSTSLLKEGTPRENVSRFNYLWPLPGTLRLRQAQPQVYGQIATWLTDALADDIERHKPEMIIVDSSPNQRALPANFQLLPWLKEFGRFATAWKRYGIAETINACSAQVRENCAYDVYVRSRHVNEW